MNAVRLLHIVGDSGFGGAAKIILRLAEKMKAEGWQVDILTTDLVFAEAARKAQIDVVDLDVIHREIRPWRDLAGLVRLFRFLRLKRYLVVHTHTSKAGFVGRLAAWLAGVPVIVHTAHGFAFHEHSPRIKRAFYSALERVAAHWCDRIVTVTEFHRRWAIELGICGEQKVSAIPNGIRVNEPCSRTSAALRIGWRKQPGDLITLAVGRLAPEKGFEHLIEATSLLPGAGQGFRVVLAGDGPLRAQLERLANELGVLERLTFLGYRTDIPDLLAACDLVVLPSVREGLSIALLEAMAAGKPIITTRIGGNLSVTSQADVAVLVPPGDPQALRDAMLRCRRDPCLRRRLGDSAQGLYERRYTEDGMLNAYQRMYAGLVKEWAATLATQLRGRTRVRVISSRLKREVLDADSLSPQ